MGKLEHYYQNYSLFISACILKNRNTCVVEISKEKSVVFIAYNQSSSNFLQVKCK